MANDPVAQRTEALLGHHQHGDTLTAVGACRIAPCRRTLDPAGSDHLHRAKGPLVFDLGICLVLITLPTLALLVALQMLTGRRQFLPPFSTWYAAMLFAVVPLRNILPGSVAAWYRHSS